MDRRAAGALLALAACFACSAAAPTSSNQTALDLYEGAPEGCYYNFQHYGEGDRIMTNEPCLNCTCHNRMLMCYLRVCPFTKAIGQDCTVEKRADQCCPIVTCPDVPVDLLTSTSTTSPAEYGATGIGKLDKFGCSISGKYFPEGSKVPPTPNKPCEHCYCIRNMTTCVMQECTLHVDGCTPIYHKDVCCPVRYSCDHPEDELPLLDDMSTTVRPTPGFLLTTTTISPVTQMTQDCVHDDRVFSDGALIKTEKACEHCYCMKGDIVCVVQECGAPMENEGKNCSSLPPREGQCCPDTYICEGDELPSDLLNESTTESIIEKLTTLSPPRRTSVEGSGYRNEPDETPYTDMPITEPEGEGSGDEEETPKPLGPDEIIPTPGDDDQYIYVTTKSPAHEEHEKTTAAIDKINVPEMKEKTIEPPVSTNAPISKEIEKLTTSRTIEEDILEPHTDVPATMAPDVYESATTELGDLQNTVPDVIPDEEIAKPHGTTNAPTSESVSLPPSAGEDDKLTTSQKELDVTSSPTSKHEYSTTSSSTLGEIEKETATPADISNATPEVTTEKEYSDGDITRTTSATSAEESSAERDKETSKLELLAPSTTISPDAEEKETSKPEEFAPSTSSSPAEEEKESSKPEEFGLSTTSSPAEEEKESSKPEEFAPSTTSSPAEEESSKPDQPIPITTSNPLEKEETLTTEPDHALNTVAVAEEDNTHPHSYILTTTATPAVEEESTTVVNLGQDVVTDKVIKEDVPAQTEHAAPAAPAMKDTEFTTAEPDRGLNTIPSEIYEETSSEPSLPGKTTLSEETKGTEPSIITDEMQTEAVDIKSTSVSEVTSPLAEGIVTKGDQFTVTTEPSFRKEDEGIVSTEKPKEIEPTTVKSEFVDEGLIPTSSHDDKIGTSSDVPTAEEDFTTSVPEYITEITETIGSKQTTTESPKETSVVTEVLPEKVSEPSSEQDGDLPSSTEKLTETTPLFETHEEPSRIPGEGDCLLNGITYGNNSVVPSTNNCHTGCRCASSIIKCDPIICSPPPDYMDNCQSIYDSPDSCCPTFVCDHPRETVPPQSDNQMSGTESPMPSPTIECRGDQCEISEPTQQPIGPSGPCTSDSCLTADDHKTDNVCGSGGCGDIPQKTDTSLPSVEHTEECSSGKCKLESCANGACQLPQTQVSPVTPCEGEHCEKTDEVVSESPQQCKNGEDCKSVEIPTIEATPCEGESCNKIDCGDSGCGPDGIASPPDHQLESCKDEDGCKPQVIPIPECTGNEPCRRKEVSTSDTKLPTTCEGPNCMSEKETTVAQGATDLSSDLPKTEQTPSEEATEKTVSAEGEKVTELPDDHISKPVDEKIPVKDTQETETYTTESQTAEAVTSADIQKEKPVVEGEATKKPTTDEGKETEIPATVDEGDKEKHVVEEEITQKPTVIEKEETETPDVIEEKTTRPTMLGEEGEEKPTVDKGKGTEKPILDEDKGTEEPSLVGDEGKEKPADTIKEGTEPPTIDSEEGTKKPAIIDEDDIEKPAVSEEPTKEPAVIDDDDKEKPVVDKDTTKEPDIVDEDGKEKPVVDEESTKEPAIIDEDDNEKPVVDDESTKEPAVIDEDDKEKPVVDKETTKEPAIVDEDDKETPVIDKESTKEPAVIVKDDKETTKGPAIVDDEGKEKPVVDEESTKEPAVIDEDGKEKPVVDKETTKEPAIVDEDGKETPVVDKESTKEPAVIVEDDKDTTKEPAIVDDEGKEKPVVDEESTKEPAVIDEDGKEKPVVDKETTKEPAIVDEDDKETPVIDKESTKEPAVIVKDDKETTKEPAIVDDEGKEKPVVDEESTKEPAVIDEDGKEKPVVDKETTKEPAIVDEDGKETPVVDKESTKEPAVIVEDDKETTKEPAIVDDEGKEKPVVDEESTKEPAVIDEDGKEKPVVDKETTKEPAIVDEDGKETPVVDEESTKEPGVIVLDDKETTKEPAIVDEEGKEKPVVDEESTKVPVIIDEYGKETPVVVDEITKKPDLIEEEGTTKPLFTEEEATTLLVTGEKATELPAIKDKVSTDVPAVADTDTDKPSLIDGDSKDKPMYIEKDNTDKPTIAEDATDKPVIVDEEGKPTDIDMKDIGKPEQESIDEFGSEKPALTDKDVTNKPAVEVEATENPDVIKDETTAKAIVTDEDRKEKPGYGEDEVSEKPIDVEEKGTEEPTVITEDGDKKPDMTEKDDKEKPDIIGEMGTEKPAVIDEQDTGKPITEENDKKPAVFEQKDTEKTTDVDMESTEKPLVEQDGKKDPAGVEQESTEKTVTLDDSKSEKSPGIEEEHKDKPLVSEGSTVKPDLVDEDKNSERPDIDEGTEEPAIVDKDKEKPAVVDQDEKEKPAVVETESIKKPTVIEAEGSELPVIVGEENTKKPDMIDEEGIKKPVTEEDTIKPFTIEEESTGAPDIIGEEGTAKPVIIDEGTEEPTIIEKEVTMNSAGIEKESTELPAVSGGEGTDKPAIIDEEAKGKPHIFDQESTKTPAIVEEVIEESTDKPSIFDKEGTDKPVLIDDESKIKPVGEVDAKKPILVEEKPVADKEGDKPFITDEKVTDKPADHETLSTEEPKTHEVEGSGTDIPETAHSSEPGDEAKSPEITVQPTEVTVTDIEKTTRIPYSEAQATVTEEVAHAYTTESNAAEPIDLSTAPQETPETKVTEAADSYSKGPVIHDHSRTPEITTESLSEQEITTKTSVPDHDKITISEQDIEVTTFKIDTTDVMEEGSTVGQDLFSKEPAFTTKAPELHKTSESVEKTTETGSITEREEVPTVTSDIESPTTKVPSTGSVISESQETDKPELHVTSKSEDESTTKVYEEEKIKPILESHVTEASSTLPSHGVTDISEVTDEQKLEPELPVHGTESDEKPTQVPFVETKTDHPEQHSSEKEETITESPDYSATEPVRRFTEIEDPSVTGQEEIVTEYPKETTVHRLPSGTDKIDESGDVGSTEKPLLTDMESELPGKSSESDKPVTKMPEQDYQTQEAEKDKPTDEFESPATEIPISVVTESHQSSDVPEKDVISYEEKTTVFPDLSDHKDKVTAPPEGYTEQQEPGTEIPQHHVTTTEDANKPTGPYVIEPYVTEPHETSTKSVEQEVKDDQAITTDIPLTSEKEGEAETTAPELMHTESHDLDKNEPSITEIQQVSTELPIEGVHTELAGVQTSSEVPQSLVTEHKEGLSDQTTVSSIPKEKSTYKPELQTTQSEEISKAPEQHVMGQEEMQTEAPVLVTEPVDESKKEPDDKITHVSEDTVTEKQDTATTLRESPAVTEEIGQVEVMKSTEHTSAQTEFSETTPYLIELEEHTHKIVEDLTTVSPSEEEHSYKPVEDTSTVSPFEEEHSQKPVEDVSMPSPSEKEHSQKPVEDISTSSPPAEEYTPKIEEHVSTVSPLDEKPTTVQSEAGQEPQVSELTTKKTDEEFETSTKETDGTTKSSEELLPEDVSEKVSESVPVEETTPAVIQGEDTKYTADHKEYTTAGPTQITEESTPNLITESDKLPISESDIAVPTEKEISTSEKPSHPIVSHETTLEEEFIFATTKATTIRQGEDIVTPVPDDKFATPEEKPSETSEVPSSSTTTEVSKPSIPDLLPTDEIPVPDEDGQLPPTSGYGEPDYVEEDQAFGPGTCRYGGKVYVSAQQIPRDDPCDFCFCFRSDIICLQQSCPPPIHGCHEEPIQGFCCPRYECPVSMATTVNVTTTTTTTTTTLPPHFPTHSYKGAAQRRGCQIKGHTYKVGEVVRSSSGPCLHCTCGGDGQMKCDPKACTPEPMLRQMIAAAVSAKRRR